MTKEGSCLFYRYPILHKTDFDSPFSRPSFGSGLCASSLFLSLARTLCYPTTPYLTLFSTQVLHTKLIGMSSYLPEAESQGKPPTELPRDEPGRLTFENCDLR